MILIYGPVRQTTLKGGHFAVGLSRLFGPIYASFWYYPSSGVQNFGSIPTGLCNHFFLNSNFSCRSNYCIENYRDASLSYKNPINISSLFITESETIKAMSSKISPKRNYLKYGLMALSG
jgi:hypothetical protein